MLHIQVNMQEESFEKLEMNVAQINDDLIKVVLVCYSLNLTSGEILGVLRFRNN